MHDEVIGFVREALGLSLDVGVSLSSFEGRGSDRAYFRFRWEPGNSAIVVHYQMTRIENSYYADIARFLGEISVPVPEIIRHDPVQRFIIMHDLGDTDLWTLRTEPWNIRRGHYQKTLRIVQRLHSYSEQRFPSDRVRLMEPFSPALYRWERDYFKENFTSALCGVHLEADAAEQLEAELAGLAVRLASGRRSLVHRDLQSQNVMLWEDEPYLIDFQGMRFGSRFYDLGSLLCDPYVTFSASERDELLLFYYEISGKELDWKSFQNAFWEASAQRLMQALGAYGFLGLARGLKNYLKHVPAGLRNLRAAAEHADSLPQLFDICTRCEKALMCTEPRSERMLLS
jgi:aminoglycoside/choline kinase family phosphotransferase